MAVASAAAELAGICRQAARSTRLRVRLHHVMRGFSAVARRPAPHA